MNIPGVKIAIACIPEAWCFYSDYDEPVRNIKCSMYIIKCVIKQLAGIRTCLYDLAVDIAINIFMNRFNFYNYDYVTILGDVLVCAGLDEWAMNYLKDKMKY